MTTGSSCLSLVVIKSKFSYLFLSGIKLTPRQITLACLQRRIFIQTDVKHFTWNKRLRFREDSQDMHDSYCLEERDLFYEERESSFINFFSQDDSKVSLPHASATFVTTDLDTSLCLNLRQQATVWGKDNLGVFG